jgi:AraC-like DNA-binding protein
MARPPRVDVDRVRDEAFGLHEDHPPFVSEWHAHAKHQILYAAGGVMTLNVTGRTWTLPPLRAAWIPAGERHRASSVTGVELRTVYLDPRLAPAACAETRVFAVVPLAREMILHAMRWGPSCPVPTKTWGPSGGGDPTRHAFFLALAGLVREWAADEKPYYLPEAKTPELAAAMAWTREHLVDATVPRAAKASHVSVRTLSRRFEEEARVTFRDYLQAARMVRAMELLAAPRASISQTAFDVGFRSAAAFTTAFRERCGETPTEYRARLSPSAAPLDARRTARPARRRGRRSVP